MKCSICKTEDVIAGIHSECWACREEIRATEELEYIGKLRNDFDKLPYETRQLIRVACRDITNGFDLIASCQRGKSELLNQQLCEIKNLGSTFTSQIKLAWLFD